MSLIIIVFLYILSSSFIAVITQKRSGKAKVFFKYSLSAEMLCTLGTCCY